LCVQGAAGAAFGLWAARRGLPPEAIRSIALTTAARTLLWGGCAFVLYGLLTMAFPGVADLAMTTPLHVHNLDTLGLPFALVLFTVMGIGRRRSSPRSRSASRCSPATGSATRPGS